MSETKYIPNSRAEWDAELAAKGLRQIGDAEWFSACAKTVTVSVQEVADRFHVGIYGDGTVHFSGHSCPCYHHALYYLGLLVVPMETER